MARAATIKTILVVEAQHERRLATKWFLANFGYSVETARSVEEARLRFNPAVHDAVVSSSPGPETSGHELARWIKRCSPGTPILMRASVVSKQCHCADVILPPAAHLLALTEALRRLSGQ